MKVRVLHCLESVASGGVEQTRLSLARHLDHDRFEQSLICTKTLGGLPAELEKHGTSIRRIGTFRNIWDRQRYAAALAHVRAFRPHIIHGAVYEGVAVAAVAGRLGRVPVIIGEETTTPDGRSWRGHLLYRALMTMTHHAVAISPAVEQYLVGTLRLPKAHVTCIENGVAPPREIDPKERAALRERLGVADRIVVGAVGRLLDSHKGHSLLVRAARELHDRGLPVHVVIVGDGPAEEALRSLAAELNLSAALTLAGYQPDTAPWYGIMDVLAHPAWFEGFGLVIAEAMFAGLPVVATSVGGIPDVASDGETGFLVPPGDVGALVERLAELVRDDELRRKMGEAGKCRAQTMFSETRYARDVSALYDSLLSKFARSHDG